MLHGLIPKPRAGTTRFAQKRPRVWEWHHPWLQIFGSTDFLDFLDQILDGLDNKPTESKICWGIAGG
jgi:hypothetical protein